MHLPLPNICYLLGFGLCLFDGAWLAMGATQLARELQQTLELCRS